VGRGADIFFSEKVKRRPLLANEKEERSHKKKKAPMLKKEGRELSVTGESSKGVWRRREEGEGSF